MDPVSVLYGLSQFVPGLLRWAGHDKGAEVADKAVKAVAAITGKDQLEDGIAELKANPELALRFQQTMNDVMIHQIDGEAKELAEINATMRAEYASKDPYIARARPTMMYALTFVWTLQMLAISYVIIFQTQLAPGVINALAALSVMWSVALGVLGVAVVKRSEDKQVAAGFSPVGILGSVAKAIIKK